MPPSREVLIEMTAAKLEKIYQEIDRAALTSVECAGMELAEELETAKVAEGNIDESKTSALSSATKWELSDAWRRGLHPDDHTGATPTSYALRIEHLIANEDRHPAETYALDVHAISYLETGETIPASLRSFIIKRLLELRHPKTADGAPRVDEERNLQLVALIEELISSYGLTAYGSVENVAEGSACWIVAQANIKLGKRPREGRCIAKIFRKVRNELKASRR
ncbi:hypothetical protein Q4577_23760 [Marinovum sp. 2_MG-2023]|uniref:hypothetical protein n=1 Tax=unclassified Marinovum TaxID=2647166 RepID=UPI0026E2D819|nr:MULTISPECIES: hypothetical protein [unclassified Marinovum]MDO6733022.1 hypothetical protein [Marinovum sp. 2_MG-2023]MDO6782288.1 hypothetical protein [Marinovum sp. 1_MG-2023]